MTTDRATLPKKKDRLIPEHEALIAALLTLSRLNVPTDVQALLVYGDGRGCVAPGALAAALSAAIRALAGKEQGK